MWQAERAAFGPDVLAPDLYALGDTLQDWASGVLDLLGPEPAVVIGCSVGGSCALEVARAAPDRVAGLVLVGAKAGVRPEPALRDEALRLLETRGLDAAWGRYWAPLLGADATPGLRARLRALALAQPVAHVARGVRAFHDRRDLSTWLEGWDKPLLGVSGSEDRTPSPDTVARLATGPRRRFVRVEGCGHYVSLERPAAFRRLLSDALPWLAAPA